MAETTIRRRRVSALAVAAGVLVVAELVGSWSSRSGGSLVVAQVLHHPVLFGSLALAALAAAVTVGVPTLLFRSLVLVTAALIGIVAAVPVLLLAGTGRELTMTEAAPSRSDRHLVVEERAAVIDPLWWVRVDEGFGLTKRRWQVGYFNGDASTDGLVEVSWAGPDRVLLVTGGEGDTQVQLVALASESGEPSRTLSRG
ncbi:hypothetical protein [Streptomyces wuyuanensis]|uniref:hypothetical protein n=1 Tax=Streptomyces wuyuanensis TaxID=1196353 RepID=UPI003713CFA1